MVLVRKGMTGRMGRDGRDGEPVEANVKRKVVDSGQSGKRVGWGRGCLQYREGMQG